MRLAAAYSWLGIALLGIWELWARLHPSPFIPPVSTILASLGENWFSTDPARVFVSPSFTHDLLASLARAGVGWGITILIGVGGGLVLGVWRPAAAFFRPLIRFGMSIPATALLPLTVVFFGITSEMNISLIVAGTVWAILVNTMDGVQSIDSVVSMTARSMRLGRVRHFFQVLLPGASPQIMVGLRVSLGLTLILMVISELFAATNGIGYFVVLADQQFRYLDMWSGVALIAIVGIIANALFALLEARLLNWHHSSRSNILE